MTAANPGKADPQADGTNSGTSHRRAAAVRTGAEGQGKVRIDDIIVLHEYRTACDLLAHGYPVVFVTGNAGTGKSTLIRFLRNVLEKQAVVLAPTGVAALNVEGATIHSFFRFPPHLLDEDDIKQARDRQLYRKLELLIIDEVSMVRCDLMDAMDRFLRRNRGNNEPFGGVQLLLIGDLFQLPPVVPHDVREALQARGYSSPHFFSAFALQRIQMMPVELTSVYRQEAPEFVGLLNQLRVGDNLEAVSAELNRYCYQPHQPAAGITLTCTNRQADAINREMMNRLPSPEFTFTGTISGQFTLEQERLPSPLDLRLKQDARVMFTRNDDQRRWVNGSMGIVREVAPGGVLVEVTGHSAVGAGQVHDVSPVTWETYRYVYDATADRILAQSVGMYKQYPLMPAWAVTIHKSQGKTMERVLVDLGRGAFAAGQAYVALSRCRTLEGMRLTRPIKPSDFICDPAVARFYGALDMESASG